MNRRKIEERKQFTKEEKQFILDKSCGRCCHCGKELHIGDNFTVEHAIPLSKGGTNQPWNIVALCKECNDTKADFVVDIEDYYKYLNKDELELLVQKQVEYFELVNWFEMKNITKHDTISIRVLSQNNNSMNIVKKRKKYYTEAQEFEFIMQKAVYSDLDSVYKLMLEYDKRYSINREKEEVKQIISNAFQYGIIYILRNKEGKLVCAIPMAFTMITDIFVEQCVLKVFTPVYSEIMLEDTRAVHLAIEYIIENIKEIFDEYKAIPMIVSKACNDWTIQITNQFRVGNCYFMPFKNENNIVSEYAIYESDLCTDEYEMTDLFDKFSEETLKKLGRSSKYLLKSTAI